MHVPYLKCINLYEIQANYNNKWRFIYKIERNKKSKNLYKNWRPLQNDNNTKPMWTDSPSQIIKNKKSQRPKTYFQLIERVGADGAYQFKIFLIFMLVWFYTGIILLNMSFLFYNKDFQCQQHGLLAGSCEDAICQLPIQDRRKFINKEDNYFNSIAIQLGEFHCQDEIYVDLARCSVYLGSLIGFLVFSYLSDNIGRKISILISLCVCVVGNILVSASPNLIMASFGLLLSGGGANASINTSLCFFNEVTKSEKRQKYSILVQFSFTIGAILVTGFYFMIPHWRIISIFLITIPSLISLFLVFFYVQETPQFLLKKSNSQAIKSLNRIGKINFMIKNIIEEEDILCVRQRQTSSKQFNQLKLKHIDLIRCSSLRQTTIYASFICFTIYAMYYGSMMVINSLGFDIYSSNFVTQLAQLVVFLPIYAYIKQIKRKVVGMVSFLILVGISGILIVIEIPEKCDMCAQSIVQLVFIFLFRSVVAFYFCVSYLYINELFPTRVTGLGVGFVSVFGALASIFSPIVFDLLNNNILMMIFCGLALIGAAVSHRMEQTVGRKLKIQVQQIQLLKQKQKVKQKSLITGRSSFAKYSYIKSVIKQQND